MKIYREFKTTTINKSKSVLKKVDSMKGQMGNFSKDTETIRKNGHAIKKISNMSFYYAEENSFYNSHWFLSGKGVEICQMLCQHLLR